VYPVGTVDIVQHINETACGAKSLSHAVVGEQHHVDVEGLVQHVENFDKLSVDLPDCGLDFFGVRSGNMTVVVDQLDEYSWRTVDKLITELIQNVAFKLHKLVLNVLNFRID